MKIVQQGNDDEKNEAMMDQSSSLINHPPEAPPPSLLGSSPNSVMVSSFHDEEDASKSPLQLPRSAMTTPGETLKSMLLGNKPSLAPQLTSTSWPVLASSAKSQRTVNPIRAIVDPIAANIQTGEARGDGKDHISLALGDPTAAGNLPPCPVAIQAVLDTLQSAPFAAGYQNACGTAEARRAIAKFHSSAAAAAATSPDHVIVASGCSGALELALTSLLDADSILLVPEPGFPLYQVIAESHGAQVVHYRLLPDQNWQCDLTHLRELLERHQERVRGVLVNNPSNPTGAVFSLEHLQDIVAVCQDYHMPIVADEVYGDLTFASHEFHPLAQVAADWQVPVITASGLAKQFLVPGWRVGWIVFSDNNYGSLREVEAGAKRLAQVILGASHLAQTAVPALLDPPHGADVVEEVIQHYKAQLRQTLETQANFLCNKLSNCPGLTVAEPGGAMYAMVQVDATRLDVQTDVDFSKALLREENVFVLPGSCFRAPQDNDIYFFRAVFCAPTPILATAVERIHQFCTRHNLH